MEAKKDRKSRKRNRPGENELKEDVSSKVHVPKQLTSPQLQFRQACEQGNLQQANHLIIQTGVTDWVHGFLEACKAGHLEIVKILIDRGILKNKKGRSQVDQAFTFACTHGHVPIVELLYLNNIHSDNEDCLRLGVTHGHLPIVKLAIAKGATDIHRAKQTACRQGNLEILRFLLGIERSRPPLLSSLMETACQSGQLSIVSFLITQFIPQSESDWFDWITCACNGGHVNVIQCIIQHAKSNPIAIRMAQHALNNSHSRVKAESMIQLCDLQVPGWTPVIYGFTLESVCDDLILAGFTPSMFWLSADAKKVEALSRRYSRGVAWYLSLYLISDVIGLILPFLFRTWPLVITPSHSDKPPEKE